MSDIFARFYSGLSVSAGRSVNSAGGGSIAVTGDVTIQGGLPGKSIAATGDVNIVDGFIGGSVAAGGDVNIGGSWRGNSIASGGDVTIAGSVFSRAALGRSEVETLQGNGEAGEETRSLPPIYSKVNVSALNQVEILPGSGQAGVRLQGDSNLLSQVETVVKDDTLFIRPKPETLLKSQTPLSAQVFLGDLSGISASAATAVKAAGVLARDLKVSASSGAQVDLSGKVEGRLEVDASSGSRVHLEGAAANLYVDSTSGARVDAFSMSASMVLADVASGGQASVHAEEKLFADASSAGQVWYLGTPKVKQSTSSGGSVSPKSL